MQQSRSQPFSQYPAAEKRKLLLLFSVCTILWGSAFTAITIDARQMDPGHLSLMRYLFASVILIVYARIVHMPLPKLREVPFFLLTGFLTISCYNIFLIAGQKTVNAGTASVIIALQPVISAVLAGIFLGEQVRLKGMVGIVLAFLGVTIAVVDYKNGIQFSRGVFLILVAAASSATSTILQKKWMNRYTGPQILTYSIWGGTLLLMGYLPGLIRVLPELTTASWLTTAYLAIFPGVIAYLVWGYLLSRIPAHQANSFLFLDAIVAMLIAWIVLGEVPGVQVLAEFCLIVVGLVLVNGRLSQRTEA